MVAQTTVYGRAHAKTANHLFDFARNLTFQLRPADNSLSVHCPPRLPPTTANMDTNMMDVDGDIILDVDPSIEAQAMQTQDYGAEVGGRG